MNFLKNSVLKMDKRIYFVFILVVSVAIANAVLSTVKIRNNKNTIFEITQYTNPTLESLEEFNLLVTRSRMFISNWVYLPNNNNDKYNLVQINKVNYPRLKSKLTGLTKGWRSDGNVEKVEKLFIEYETVIREQEKIMKSLTSFDDYQDPFKKFLAEEQLESEIIPSTNKIMVNLRELITIKKEEATKMQNAMLQDNVHLLVIVFSLAIMVIVSVMMAGAYMMKKVILPLMRVREILLQMSAGELPEVKIDTEKSALAEMKTALYQLREGLQRTSSFAGEIGRGNFNANFQPLSEKDVLGSTLLEMRDKLKHAAEDDAIRNWASEGYANISSVLHKNTEDIKKLSEEIICGLVTYIEAGQGAIYLVNDTHATEPYIEQIAVYAPGMESLKPCRLNMNEGLIGNAIAANNRIHLRQSGDNLLIADTESQHIADCEILILPLFSGGRVIGALEIRASNPLLPSKISFVERISEPVAANILNLKANLLTRQLLEESQLKTTELAIQDEELRQINNELMLQSEKLKQSESELRKQSDILLKVNTELETKALLLEEKNMAVEDAHKALAFKAGQLERSNKYKSDFLANMSHELRTPLNSVLILAKLLGENRLGNMTEKQVEHAKVIHKSGSDLLVIINDILDLSKIEAGKLQLQKEITAVSEICNNMMLLFMEVSRDKQINFTTVMDPGLPEFINTDRVRVEQVLKNLLGNAFKFTPEGGDVTLKVYMADEPLRFHNKKLLHAKKVVCFSVCDSGIGIQEENQKLIFDAFNQADSSITRKFGGTGLGLAICRQLSALLGGEINLVSKEGEGSVFSLFLSADTDAIQDLNHNERPDAESLFKTHAAGGSVLLLCDNNNDVTSWKSLFEAENFEVVSGALADSDEVDFKPDIIVMDATLSDTEYIRKVERIREFENTRNAVLICRSVSEYIPAEISQQVKLHTTAALNKSLLAAVMNVAQATPAMMHTLPNDSGVLNSASEAGHFNVSNSEQASNKLSGIKVLIADDDIRNIYSMTSVFEHEGAEVLCAMDGFEAIEVYKTHSDLSVILMDIMMPGKDGLQAIREIRAMEGNSTIPIIAVTAKAMRDDREICINAGANDYITKPVRLELLLNKVYHLLKEKQA